MNDPITPQLLSLIHGEQVQPAIVETTTEHVDGNEYPTIYIGYPLPTCTSTSDKKWLIKRVQTIGNAQTIQYANGARQFNQSWDERAALTYKFNEIF